MYTRQELAALYGVSRNTITRRLKEMGIVGGKMITPKQLNLIIEELGKWDENENDFTVNKPRPKQDA